MLALPRNLACLACAERHRAFAAGLRNRGGVVVRAAPVPQVLRRVQREVLLQGVWLLVRLAQRLIRRGSTLVTAGGYKALPDRQARMAALLRESIRIGTRLRERACRTLHLHHSRVLVCVRTRDRLPQSDARVREARTVMLQRVERQVMFPRVAQVMVRGAPPRRAHEVPVSPLTSSAVEQTVGQRNVLLPVASKGAGSLPAAELSRVTEHVIRQLDRRVLSYRERMGQL
jgi:hypothetical protein